MKKLYVLLLILVLFYGATPQSYAEETPPDAADATKEDTEQTTKDDTDNVVSKHTKPLVTISGVTIETKSEVTEKNFLDILPDALHTKKARAQLKKRAKIVPAKHNAHIGLSTAPLHIIAFTDLSCTPCKEVSKRIEKIRADLKEHVQITHIYMPKNTTSGTNLAEFYGKIAQKYGKFWDYRKALLKAPKLDEDMYLELLLNAGVNKAKTRSSAMRDARRLYKELDWDAAFANKAKLKEPPHIYVNGIHLGAQAIDLKYLEDIVTYESYLLGIKKE